LWDLKRRMAPNSILAMGTVLASFSQGRNAIRSRQAAIKGSP